MNGCRNVNLFKFGTKIIVYKHIGKSASLHTSSLKSKSFKEWYKDLWTSRTVNQPPFSHVTQIGDPVLRQIATPVPPDMLKSQEVQMLVKRMIQVMHQYNCVGLAAPQIGVPLRIFVMEFPKKLIKEITPTVYEAKQMETLPLTICINPELKVTNFNEKIFPEGCMSVRGYSADVARFEAVTLNGFTDNGEKFSLNLNGWNARIAQHELDHLNGKIYIDVMDRSTFTCTCWETVNAKSGRIEIPFYK